MLVDVTSKCNQIHSFFGDLVIFTEEIVNGNLCFCAKICLPEHALESEVSHPVKQVAK